MQGFTFHWYYILILLCFDNNHLDNRRTVLAFAGSKTNKKPSIEHELYNRGYKYVIGTDEVGRGAIAGPVLSTSCCIFHNNNHVNNNMQQEQQDGIATQQERPSLLIQGVNDSKQISEVQREIIYQQVVSQPSIYKFACAQRSPSEIDQQNILKATMECFQTSIQNLILQENIPLEVAYAICDGKSTPKLVGGPTPIPCRPMVGADAKVYVVSLASIIAKVTRDRIMVEAHKEWPNYNFHLNKGYSTRDHIERIHKYGPCPLHRMSFKALKYR